MYALNHLPTPHLGTKAHLFNQMDMVDAGTLYVVHYPNLVPQVSFGFAPDASHSFKKHSGISTKGRIDRLEYSIVYINHVQGHKSL